MKLVHALLLSVVPLLSASCNRATGAVEAEPADPATIKASNAFAFELYQRLREEPGNLFFSPYSISTALAMTAAGAKGATAEEMAAVLHLPKDLPGGWKQFGALDRHIKSTAAKGKAELVLTNSLWSQQGYPYQPGYLALLKQEFGASLTEVDFIRAAEQARGRINDWVEKQTRERIKDLMPQGSLDEMTRLVLVNAIYFKGRWAEPFKKERTSEAAFHVAPDQSQQVPMMHRRDDYDYYEDEQIQALRLPYEQDQLSMLILLPRQTHGLTQVEESIDTETLTRVRSQLRREEVDVQLPRFRLEAQFDLSRELTRMGMKTAFTDAADFSGISTAEDLKISAVVHKAFVDVNEEGTEAAAATGIAVAATAFEVREPKKFHANHPFVFAILDQQGTVLFLGRLRDPG